MKNQLHHTIRDIFLVCTLLFLVKIAIEHNYSFLAAHKQSIIHELDRSFLDQLYMAQRQIHHLNQTAAGSDTFAITITDIQNRLATIEEKYKKNSPGLALLGPIGTASIVMKEEELNKKLLDTINDLGKVLHSMHSTPEAFQPATTIDTGLMTNKSLIKTLV